MSRTIPTICGYCTEAIEYADDVRIPRYQHKSYHIECLVDVLQNRFLEVVDEIRSPLQALGASLEDAAYALREARDMTNYEYFTDQADAQASSDNE